MRIFPLFFLILSSVIFSQAAVEVPWFGDVKSPVAIGLESGKSLALSLRAGLLKHSSPAQILKEVPVDDKPRVIFLTLMDGVFPSRCYFATGYNLKDTLERLLVLVERREKEYISVITDELSAQVEEAKEEKRRLSPVIKTKMEHPGHWNALQLDIVQATLPIAGFHIPSSRLLLSSVVGIAFDQGASFAFTPEQLTGRCLMTPGRQLSKTNVANLITESSNWNAWKLWNKMCAMDAKFPVWVFESDSYYADEKGACRLYRGNPIEYGVKEVTAEQLLGESNALLEKILGMVNGRGMVVTPFLEWYPEVEENQESLFSMARLAWMLVESSGEKGLSRAERSRRLDGASRICRMLLKATKHYDANEKRSLVPETSKRKASLPKTPRRKASEREFACLIEQEQIEKEGINDSEIPRRVAMLDTNVMAFCAYMRLYEALGDKDTVGRACGAQLKPLLAHILGQFKQDGEFVFARLYPENTPATDIQAETDDIAQVAAMCGLAALHYAGQNPTDPYSVRLPEFAGVLYGMLKKKFFIGEESVSLAPPMQPLLVRFMGHFCTSEDKAMQVGLQQMALTALRGIEHKPFLPDMYGTPVDIPSMTYAAQLMWVCCEVSAVIAKCGGKADAAAILQEAWPIWVFQQHAQVNNTVASALPQPYKYIGYHRDNLADFGFTMEGQLTQINSRRALLRALSALDMSGYHGNDEQLKEAAAVWGRLNHHPICLTNELVLASETAGEYNDRNLMGALSKPTVTKTQTKHNYRASTPRQRFSSGIRKQPAQPKSTAKPTKK